MKPCDFLRRTIVVCIIASESTALRCHEGYNVSIAGIPLYMWAEQDCDGPNYSCMIQELDFHDKAVAPISFTMRYGGCFPSKLARLMLCSTSMLRHGKLEDIRELSEILDSKLSSLVATMEKKPELFWSKLLSRGNGIEEFYAGIPQFLTHLGYDGESLEKPFLEFINKFNSKTTDFEGSILQLLDALKVKNPATTRLSHSLQLANTIYAPDDTVPLHQEHLLSMLPGLTYPLLKSATYDIDHVFNVMSESLEKQGFVPSVSDSQMISELLAIFQTMLTAMNNGGANKILQIVHQISNDHFEKYLAVYPGNTVITQAKLLTSKLSNIQRTTKEDCNDGTIICYQKNLMSILSLLNTHFSDTLYQNDVVDNEDLKVDERPKRKRNFYSDYMSAYQEFRLSSDESRRRLFSYLFEKSENLVQELLDIYKSPLFDTFDEKYFLMPCVDVVCSTPLCNSHGALSQKIRSMSGKKLRLGDEL